MSNPDAVALTTNPDIAAYQNQEYYKWPYELLKNEKGEEKAKDIVRMYHGEYYRKCTCIRNSLLMHSCREYYRKLKEVNS